MPKYNEESMRLTSTFLKYRNDIDIYTEDEDKDKEFYKKLFYRLLDGKIRINDVTPLGCKSNVINRCLTEPENGRKKIFIVDGDIKLINNSNQSHSNLFVLDKYCIENYLFHKESIIEYIYYKCGIYNIDEIEHILNFENWINEYCEIFIDLFFHFAIKDSYNSNFELFNANKYHKYCKKESKMLLNCDLVKEDIELLKQEIINDKDEKFYINSLQNLKDSWEYNNENFIKFISGKNYLIPILQFKTTEIKGTKDMEKLEVVKINLVDKFDIESLSPLREKILAL